MIQKTYFVKTKKEFITRINEVKALEEYSLSSSQLVILLVNGIPKIDAAAYIDIAKESMPLAIITGASVINSSDNWEEMGVTVSFNLFESSKAKLVYYETEDYTAKQIVKDFTKVLEETDNARVVLTYPTDSRNDFDKILDEVYVKAGENLTFWGCMSGTADYMMDNGMHYNTAVIDDPGRERKFELFSIANGIIDNGYVFVVLSGEQLHESAKYVFGWKGLGKEMHVTGEPIWDQFGSIGITEIDGMPASDIYKKYLDVDVNEYFLDNVCEFPFTMEKDNTVIARVPLYSGEKGELYFSGDFDVKAPFRLSYAIPSEIIKITRKAAKEVSEFNPEAIFLSICFNRYHFLKEQEKQEIESFRALSENTAFCFGGFEIIKSQGKGGILNSALIILALREGEGIKDKNDVIVMVEEPPKSIKPLVERLTYFVDVSSKELEEAYEVAEAANKSKSNFLSNMSHEIRTPINAILGMNEMILRETKDKKLIEYAENIRSASRLLNGLVNDILDFSKIEAGKMEIVPVEYELASVLNDLIVMSKKRANDKGLGFIVNVDPNIPHLLYGDEIRIKQVITNILTNAIKYTESGGVTLTVKYERCCNNEECQVSERVIKLLDGDKNGIGKDNIKLEITIEDTGIGIKPEDIDRMFKSFERVDEVRNRTIEGTGLGMNITQMLLGLMGGTLDIKSDYGVGSVFTIRLLQRVVDERPIGTFEEAIKRALNHDEEYRQMFVAPEAKILIVDDTEMNITVFKNLLKKTQVQIDSASSGMECLELCKNRKYDMIFLDHRMPEMDGIACLHHLKEDVEGLNYSTPVVALTANAISGSREMYLNEGFDDYMTKPIMSIVLEDMIMRTLPQELIMDIEDYEDKLDDDEAPEWIWNVPFIDAEVGISNCGGVASYLEGIRAYKNAATETRKMIGQALATNDIKFYTTKVHALKSSSRIIGAEEIANLAEQLEMAGNNQDMAAIARYTDELLSYHSSLCYIFKRYMDIDEKDEKEVITTEGLKEAYGSIRELAQLYDYDSIVNIMDSLANYIIPEEERGKYEELVAAVNNADWDIINQLMEG